MFESNLLNVNGDRDGVKKLFDSINKAIANMPPVPKNGYNENDDYKYVKADDIKPHVVKYLGQEGVGFCAEVKSEEFGFKEIYGRQYITCNVTMFFSLVDNETGTFVTIRQPGFAMDEGDKALYKAETGAIKYFFINNMGLDIGSIDPEENSFGPKNKRNIKKEQEKSYEPSANDSKNKKVVAINERDEKLTEIRNLYKADKDEVESEINNFLIDNDYKEDISLINKLSLEEISELLAILKGEEEELEVPEEESVEGVTVPEENPEEIAKELEKESEAEGEDVEEAEEETEDADDDEPDKVA